MAMTFFLFKNVATSMGCTICVGKSVLCLLDCTTIVLYDCERVWFTVYAGIGRGQAGEGRYICTTSRDTEGGEGE